MYIVGHERISENLITMRQTRLQYVFDCVSIESGIARDYIERDFLFFFALKINLGTFERENSSRSLIWNAI